MALRDLSYLGEETDAKMPVLFLGHGSPMNAIEDNAFVKGFREVGSVVQRPKAILCISAHWETYGTKVTAMEMPKTIPSKSIESQMRTFWMTSRLSLKT